MPDLWEGVPLNGQSYAENPFDPDSVVIPEIPTEEG